MARFDPMLAEIAEHYGVDAVDETQASDEDAPIWLDHQLSVFDPTNGGETMATGSVTLDLDGIARDAAALGWTVELLRVDRTSLVIEHGSVWVHLTRDGTIAVGEGKRLNQRLSWAVVGPLYRIIDAHTQEG